MLSLIRHRVSLILVACAVLLKVFSGQEAWVERYYTHGLYPHISAWQRALLGWIPFSVGDLLYVATGGWLVYLAVRAVRALASAAPRKGRLLPLLERAVQAVLLVYFLFNILWGLNYNRQGIAPQMGLKVAPYSDAELSRLVHALQQKICSDGDRVSVGRRATLNHNAALLMASLAAYSAVEGRLPFLRYRRPSVKPSLLSPLGPYFGFTGYYNPFTAEAQLNTAVPFFVKPFVMAHEMAHQLGYAKENEANFVSYLVLHKAADPELRYSVYFEMHAYALQELGRRDPLQAMLFEKTVHPQYVRDYASYVAYLTANQNRVEPFISKFYDRYLKLNNQPAGKGSYNLVVAWLVAYMHQVGEGAL